jgi:predicted ATPase
MPVGRSWWPTWASSSGRRHGGSAIRRPGAFGQLHVEAYLECGLELLDVPAWTVAARAEMVESTIRHRSEGALA